MANWELGFLIAIYNGTLRRVLRSVSWNTIGQGRGPISVTWTEAAWSSGLKAEG